MPFVPDTLIPPIPIGILKAANQEIGLPGLLQMANREIGGPGGYAMVSGLPRSDLRVGVVNSDFQPGAAGLHFLCQGSLVPAGQWFIRHQTCTCSEDIVIDTQAWWVYHSYNAARVGPQIVSGKWPVLNLEGWSWPVQRKSKPIVPRPRSPPVRLSWRLRRAERRQAAFLTRWRNPASRRGRPCPPRMRRGSSP